MSRLREILDYQAEQDEQVQVSLREFQARVLAQVIEAARNLKPLDPSDYILREGDCSTSAKDK